MGLEQIPVVQAAPGSSLTGNAPALLQELLVLLRALHQQGQTGAIDLGSLPLSAADLDWLRARCGSGEVRIACEAGGHSQCIETAFPGAWWVEHRDPLGRLQSQFIEVAWVPELVPADAEDVKKGVTRLEALISGLS